MVGRGCGGRGDIGETVGRVERLRGGQEAEGGRCEGFEAFFKGGRGDCGGSL
jgi:hypothetical protein